MLITIDLGGKTGYISTTESNYQLLSDEYHQPANAFSPSSL
jgi:hypothetical protein